MVVGYISGCEIRGRRGEVLNVSHLLCPDDTIVFCKASTDQMLFLSLVFFWFEAASRLRIN